MIDKIAKALAKEADRMGEEFLVSRRDKTLDIDQWFEFEIAEPLPGKVNYTLVPNDFYERLALAALRVIAPCPECHGTPLTPDFIGDESGAMIIGTCSACQLCNGTGVDPSYAIGKS